MHFADRSYRAWLDAAYTYGRNDVIFARDRNQKWLLAEDPPKNSWIVIF